MKKTIILGSALCLLGSYAANADISVGINLGEPVYAQPMYEPGYVAAPDWPSQHYDIHRHRHNDYWAGRQQQARGHAARANGNHGEENHARR